MGVVACDEDLDEDKELVSTDLELLAAAQPERQVALRVRGVLQPFPVTVRLDQNSGNAGRVSVAQLPTYATGELGTRECRHDRSDPRQAIVALRANPCIGAERRTVATLSGHLSDLQQVHSAPSCCSYSLGQEHWWNGPRAWSLSTRSVRQWPTPRGSCHPLHNTSTGWRRRWWQCPKPSSIPMRGWIGGPSMPSRRRWPTSTTSWEPSSRSSPMTRWPLSVRWSRGSAIWPPPPHCSHRSGETAPTLQPQREALGWPRRTRSAPVTGSGKLPGPWCPT
jgi:hypothetical protein